MDIRGNLRLLNGGQLLNANIEVFADDGSVTGPLVQGRLYFDSTLDVLKVYKSETSSWVALTDSNTSLVTDLDSLTDVTLGVPATGELLRYNAGTWENATLAEAGIQPLDNTLTELAALDPTGADQIIISNGADSYENFSLGTIGKALLDDATQADARTTIDAQQADAGLTSIAGLSASANDIIIATAADTYTTFATGATGRDLLADATQSDARTTLGLVPGTDVQAYDAGLGELAALATTGVVVADGADSFITRSITGTAGNIEVTDGDGVDGNPTINLATVTNTGNGGFFVKVTTDTFGRVTNSTAVTTSDITGLVSAVYVDVNGDQMTGNLDMNSNKVTGLGAPTADTDAANKAYVDALTAGLSWKNAVRVATTAALTLASDFQNGDTVDGVTLATGDRILIKDQAAPAENGIYIVQASGAPVRASDMDVAAEFDGAAVFVKEGTVNESSGWTQTATVSTVDTDAVNWSQFSGGALYTWGTGITNSGNTIYINMGAGIVELPTDEVGVDVHTGGGLFLTVDNVSASTATGAQLAIKLNGSTLSKDASGLKVADAGITETQLNSSVAGDGLAGGAGTALSVNVDDSTIEINSDSLRVKDLGISTAKLADTSVTAAKLGNDVAGVGIGGGNGSALTFDGSELPVLSGALTEFVVVNDSNVSQIATQADVASAINDNLTFAGLSDTNVTATNGHVVAGDGSVYETRKIMHRETYTQGGSPNITTGLTINHNLNQQFVIVQVYEGTSMVIPESVVVDSPTACTVTLNSDVSCTIVIMGMEGA